MNHFAVSCGHEKTAEVAAEVLRSGGNAIDAANACFIASFITEPCMASAGGGAFALIHTKEGENFLFDFFCETPKQKFDLSSIDYRPVTIDFDKTHEVFNIGRGSVAVPGAVAGIFEMQRAFGTMPIKTLFEPAIQMAKEGVTIDRFQYYDFNLLKKILSASERGRDIFFHPTTKELKQAGELIRFEYMADFLDYLSREGAKDFYHGEIAKQIIEDQISNGGFLRRNDFENYQVKIRKPLEFDYRGHLVLTNPLPSKGGGFLSIFLQEMEKTKVDYIPFSAEHINHLKSAYDAVEPFKKNPLLLGKLKDFDPSSNKRGSTSHMSIVDQWGNAVSLNDYHRRGKWLFFGRYRHTPQ